MNGGQIYIFNPELIIEGGSKYVEYDIAGRLGTLPGFSMSEPIHILFLYKGVWDIYPSNQWSWSYMGGQYTLPSITSDMGSMHWTSSLGILYGSILTIRIRQPVASFVNNISDLEFTYVYWKEYGVGREVEYCWY